MAADLARPLERAGAGLVLGAVAGIVHGDRDVLLELVTDDGRLESLDGDLDAYHVAAGAAALIAKVLADVSTILAIDPNRTLHNLGAWVARHEEADDGVS